MTEVLHNKPVIGVVMGFGSGVLYVLKTMLTNDSILKVVAGIGIWLGVIVALITFYLRVLEVIRSHRKNKSKSHFRWLKLWRIKPKTHEKKD